MKIYLAGPFFNKIERSNVEKARDILRSRNFDVFVPMEHKIEGGESMPNDIWGKKVFELDKNAISGVDCMVVMYYGMYSDSGTAWEVGFAKALNKKIVVVHIDQQQESSLMIVNGCDVNLSCIEDLKNFDFKNFSNNSFTTHTEQK